MKFSVYNSFLDNTLALFSRSDGKTRIEIRLQDDTLWLTQRQIAELYEKGPTINEHLKNIYDEGELDPDSTIRKFRIVALKDRRE